jgi:hypothetical protein
MARGKNLLITALVLAAAQLLCAAQATAGVSDPLGSGSAGDANAIAADFGPSPLMPARSDGGGSTVLTLSTWAAAGSPLESLPPPVQAAPLVVSRGALRPGYRRGVDRPPKISS